MRTPPHGVTSSSKRSPEGRGREPYIVLVGLDLSEPGGRAWRFAFDMAELKGDDSEVHAVVVGTRGLAPPPPLRDIATPGVSTAPRVSDERPGPPLRVLEHRSGDGAPRLMAMHFRTGRADRAVLRLAHEIGADLIVVATQPTTPWQRLFGGSMADRIARCAPCPVVVVRPKTHENDTGLSEYGRF